MPVTCIILVTGWSRLYKGLPIHGLACWEVCVLMSHQIDLSYLGVICHLLDGPGCNLGTLHLLCKLPDLACGKPVQVYVAIIDCLGDKLFIFKEEPKDVPMKYLGCFWGYLAKATWVCIALTCFLARSLKARQIWPSLHSIRACKTLQIFPKWYQVLIHQWTSSKKHTGPCQNHHSKQSLSCIAFFW